MLSLFPSLLTYGLVAPLLLRLTLGIVFGFWAYRKLYKKSHGKNAKMMTLGTVEAIVAILLVIGLWTQLAALVAALVLILKLSLKARRGALLSEGTSFDLVLLVIALSILFMGAGFLAFDLPL